MSVPSRRKVVCLFVYIFTCTIFSEGEVPTEIRNGLLNQSIFLIIPVQWSNPINHVIWNFKTNTLMTYLNNQLSVIDDQFDQRVEIKENGKVLIIKQLRMNDSGLYTGIITFTDKRKIHKSIYNLTVYEPVPVPSIEIVEKKNTTDWCNVTLRCSVPKSKSSLFYTWKYRHEDSSYRLYNTTGDTIQEYLQPDFWDKEVLCIVENPADSKNDTLQKFCPDGNKYSVKDGTTRKYYGLLVLFVPLAFIVSFLILKILKRKHMEAEKKIEKHDTQYIEVRASNNDDRKVLNNTKYGSSPDHNSRTVTIYASLQYPPQTNGCQ